VAPAFAAAGARVYLAGRSMARLEKVANDIGDAAGVAEVDALNESAVAAHAAAVAARWPARLGPLFGMIEGKLSPDLQGHNVGQVALAHRR
jgi:NAD(P)-dependent dehydrogenase (short-subunit alcohol dehydrogenase family)